MRELLAALQSSQVVQQELQSTHLAMEAPLGLSAMAVEEALALVCSVYQRTLARHTKTAAAAAGAAAAARQNCEHSERRWFSLVLLESVEGQGRTLAQAAAGAAPLLYSAAPPHQEPRKEEA
jgi:hypothetical protein